MLKQSRQAFHSGSYYSKNPKQLNSELDTYLQKTTKNQNPKLVKAIIAPHAGYYYSGPTAAWSYQYLKKPHNYKRVFIFGPSHHKYFPGCTLTYMDEYATPFGPLPVDIDIVDKLKQEQGFHMINLDDQEEQHSIEMHLPYIYKTLGKQVKIIPILTGPVNEEMATKYGQIFAPYFDNDENLFIFSSDFCHWGPKFDFNYHKTQDGQIWQSIEKLDGQGMIVIQNHDYKSFEKYINISKNTICGRHVIFLFLKIISFSKFKSQIKTKFVKYSQSQKVIKSQQSSVSYASSITYI